MKVVYCAACGTKLPIMRKALPKFGAIIDIVQVHTCPDSPIEFDLKPVDVPIFVTGKFVQKLNELQPPPKPLGMIGTDDLKDRRAPEHIKSSAPSSLLDSMRRQTEED